MHISHTSMNRCSTIVLLLMENHLASLLSLTSSDILLRHPLSGSEDEVHSLHSPRRRLTGWNGMPRDQRECIAQHPTGTDGGSFIFHHHGHTLLAIGLYFISHPRKVTPPASSRDDYFPYTFPEEKKPICDGDTRPEWKICPICVVPRDQSRCRFGEGPNERERPHTQRHPLSARKPREKMTIVVRWWAGGQDCSRN